MLCDICPRSCGAKRTKYAGDGVCGVGYMPKLARAAPHFGEEPCVSGERGSGAVFFSGCPLGCVYCQNDIISREGFGEYISPERLAEIFLELQKSGVHNINLVTAGHFTPAVVKALILAKLKIPVVFNTSGYEKPETLRMLEGHVKIYLSDLKYMGAQAGAEWSGAPDYAGIAKAAALEMYRQTGPFALDDEGMMTRGVMIRHLLLPGEVEGALDVIDWVWGTFPKGEVALSLMSQYTPMPGARGIMSRPVSAEEYDRALGYFQMSGLPGYFQELSSGGREGIPSFDLTGI